MCASRICEFYGTQIFGKQEFHNYSGINWKMYKISIGEAFTGKIQHIIFIADEDLHVGQNAVYKN